MFMVLLYTASISAPVLSYNSILSFASAESADRFLRTATYATSSLSPVAIASKTLLTSAFPAAHACDKSPFPMLEMFTENTSFPADPDTKHPDVSKVHKSVQLKLPVLPRPISVSHVASPKSVPSHCSKLFIAPSPQ